MDQLPTAMMGFGLGLLTASLTTAVIIGSNPATVQAQENDVNGYTLGILYQDVEARNPV